MEEKTFMKKVNKIFHIIRNKLYHDLNDLGLSPQEFILIMEIFRLNKEGKFCTTSLLAEIFNVTLPAIMHKLASLDQKGLIIKEEDNADKRIKYFYLEKKIYDECEKICQRQSEQFTNYVNHLGLENYQKFSKLLDLTLEHLEGTND